MSGASGCPSFLPVRLADGQELHCRVQVSVRARRLRLRVSARGEVVLVIPRHMADKVDAAQAFAQACAGWLERTLQRVHTEIPQALLLPEHLRLPLLGIERRLVLRERPGAGSSVGIQDDGSCLCLWGAAQHTHGACLALQRWTRAQATAPLIRMVEQAARAMGERLGGVQVRGQRSRWGSCSFRRVISLNYRLALTTAALAHFVILHELCHLRYMDHSPAYRRHLASFEPHWEERERELRQAWRELPAWSLIKTPC